MGPHNHIPRLPEIGLEDHHITLLYITWTFLSPQRDRPHRKLREHFWSTNCAPDFQDSKALAPWQPIVGEWSKKYCPDICSIAHLSARRQYLVIQLVAVIRELCSASVENLADQTRFNINNNFFTRWWDEDCMMMGPPLTSGIVHLYFCPMECSQGEPISLDFLA